jgi:hypothetical protein
MDPGRYTYSDAPPDWRRWFKGTAAHNTVRVDGVDQTPYHRGKPKGPIAEGRLVTRQTAPGFDAIVGEARSPVYDAVHRRRVLFVGGEYWIIEDDLRGEGSHTYDLRFHLAPSAMDRTSIEASTAAMIVHAPGLTLAFSPRREVTIEPGWIAPVYGTRWPAPVINVRAVAPSARFVTLVLPRSVDTAPRMAVVEDRGIRSLTLDAAGPRRDGCDRVIWSDEPRRIELGPFAGEATAVWLRESRCGDPLLVRALTPAGSVGWSAGGGPVLENVEAR